MKPVIYPLDLIGTNPANLIGPEYHTVTAEDMAFRTIRPELAPFYEAGLIITHLASDHQLVKGVDYFLTGRLSQIENMADKPLYSRIIITNKLLKGNFSVDAYRTIGGEHVRVHSEVLRDLANILTSPRIVKWENVLDKYSAYAPRSHRYHISDLINSEVTIAAMEALVKSTADRKESDKAPWQALLARITAQTATLASSGFKVHVNNKNNPHGYTAADIGAVATAGDAADTEKAYGKTLEQLTDYINSLGIGNDDLSKLISLKNGNTVSGDIIMEGANKLGSSDEESNLSFNNGKLLWTSRDGGVLGGSAMTVVAGPNRLTIGSGLDGLKLNGDIVLHKGNISRFMPAIGASTYNVKTVNTPTITWTGLGSQGAPLVPTAVYPAASLTAYGIAQLSDSITSTSTTQGAHISVLSKLDALFNTLVDDTIAVNGKRLNANVVLSKDDIGLGKVANKADVDLALSTSLITALAGISAKNHSHGGQGSMPDAATETSDGVFNLSNAAGTSQVTMTTPAMAKAVDGEITALDLSRARYMPKEVLDPGRIGYTRELMEHLNEPNPHGIRDLTLDSVGGGDLIDSPAFNSLLKEERETRTGNFTKITEAELEWTATAAFPLTQIVSKALYSRYNTSVWFSSSSTQGNAGAFFVLLAMADNGDTLHFMKANYGTLHGQSISWAVVLNYGLTGRPPELTNKPIIFGANSDDSNSNWALLANCRLDVRRDGDLFNLIPHFFTSGGAGVGGMANVTLDLKSYPELARFRKACKIGYGGSVIGPCRMWFNDNGNRWQDTNAMDNPATHYLKASALAPHIMKPNAWIVASGAVASGGTIPVPNGSRRELCEYFISPCFLQDTFGGATGISSSVNRETGQVVVNFINNTLTINPPTISYIVIGKRI